MVTSTREIEALAQRCYTRIVANNGLHHPDYFKACIFDIIKEAIRQELNNLPCEEDGCEKVAVTHYCDEHFC